MYLFQKFFFLLQKKTNDKAVEKYPTKDKQHIETLILSKTDCPKNGRVFRVNEGYLICSSCGIRHVALECTVLFSTFWKKW